MTNQGDDMYRSRFRKSLLACLLTAVVFAAASTAAGANIYCVNDSGSDCTSTPADLQAALSSAISHSGLDTVRVGAGNYGTVANGFSYLSPDPLEIIGAGKNNTKIANWDTTNSSTGLNFQGGAGSSVSNLTIEIPPNVDSTSDTGLELNSTSDAVNINVTGPQASNARAIITSGGHVIDSSIELPNGTDANVGIKQNAGSPQIKNSHVQTYFGVVGGATAGVPTISGSTIDAIIGVSADGGEFAVRDSVIRMQNQPGAIGIGAYNYNASGTQITAHIDGVTIIDHSDNASSTGILAQGDSFNITPETANVDARNTVITNSQHPIKIQAGTNGVVNFTADYSAYDFAKVISNNNYGGSLGTINFPAGTGRIDLTGNPGFADAATGNYTPIVSSPLVDAGDPASAAGETDIAGNPRACHGKPDGIIHQDIGAFEFKTDPADDCTYPDTSIVSGPEPPPARYTSKTLEFGLASSKPGSTFRCSVDNAPETSCGAAYTTPETLALGDHDFSARAVDAFGNIDQTPASQAFGLDIHGPGPPSCDQSPKICPDTTPPRVIGLKAPKKTKAKRVKVRFKSNETGVIFTCRLNEGKAKRCKSPWKTPKLKKGKNVVQVWATDKSGNRSGIKRVTTRRK